MSAIAGVFSRQGAPRHPGEVDRMLALMASRGPNGAHTWSDDTISLGHGALHTTPESLGEVMPLVDRATGNVIVADVRLDNRTELVDALRLSGPAGDYWPGRLLLDAYREWGEDCVVHLLGDFAFVIWDERRHHLFLARDQMGAKPLAYHCSDALFAVASDSRSILELHDVPATIDRGRVFDFLVAATEWVDTTSTFFAEVKRLPPAHTLTVSATECRLRRYWHLPEPEPLILGSNEEYEEATRELLDLAVHCRVRGRHDVGVVLSGGLDSSSIAATASTRGPMRSYSAVSDHDDTNETALIHAATSRLALDASYVTPSQVRALCGDFAGAQRGAESLFDNGALIRSVFAEAERGGCRAVLTGVLADEVVAIPASLAMRSFLADRRVAAFARLSTSGGNLASNAGRLGLSRSAVSVLLTRSPHVERLLAGRRVSQRDERLRNAWRGRGLQVTDDERAALTTRLDARFAGSAPGDTPWSTRHRLFGAGYSAAALERYDRSAARYSLEHLSPFTDRRLVEFFQRLPAEQLVAGGWSKSILRRSMAGQLPGPVVWNRDKPHLGPEFTTAWVDRHPTEFLRTLTANHPLGEFVDRAELLTTTQDDDSDEWRLRCMSLGLWIETAAR